MIIEFLIAYVLLGIAAGIMAGLLGVGGGLIIVPVLVSLFTWQGFDPSHIVHLAIGTSLATIVATSISSAYAHHQHKAVLWPVFVRLAPGIVVGAVIGAIIADFMPAQTLRCFFAIFELLVAAQMLLGAKPAAHRQLPGLIGITSTGGFIGSLSSIVGIGGGTLSVPFLLWCNIDIRKAIATSAACGLPIALSGAMSYAVTGWNESALPAGSTGYLFWPALVGIAVMSILFAPVGAKLTHKLPVDSLKKIFALLLIVLGLKMLMIG